MNGFKTWLNNKKLIFPLLAFLVVGAGFGIYRSTSQASSQTASGASGKAQETTLTPPAKGVAEINGQLYVNGKPVEKPSPSPIPEERRSFDPDFVIPDRVKVQFTPDRGWGAECTPPEPGDQCVVPFDGVANLQSADLGKIVILGFENGSSTPVAQRVLEPAKKGRNFLCMRPGCPYGGAYLKYSPSPGAKYVTFRIELQDMSGKVLAVGQLDDFYLTND